MFEKDIFLKAKEVRSLKQVKLELRLNYMQSCHGFDIFPAFPFEWSDSLPSFNSSVKICIPEMQPRMWPRGGRNFELSDSTWIINHFQEERVQNWILT